MPDVGVLVRGAQLKILDRTQSSGWRRKSGALGEET